MSTKNKLTKIVKASLETKAKSYQKALSDINRLVKLARYTSVRSVNSIMTATYWEIGHRIVQVEQKGKQRADYGERIIKKMSKDLTKSLGKGFSFRNLSKYRKFYLTYNHIQKVPTVSAQFKNFPIRQTLSTESPKIQKSSKVLTKPKNPVPAKNLLDIQDKLPEIFPLPWSAYVQLLS